MKTLQTQLPFRWPFPPIPRPHISKPRRRVVQTPRKVGASSLTRKAMLADILLVISWGASIPGLMWLAAVGGF